MKTKERPILFSGPMVRAILEGRKTQTRRVINFARLSSIRRGRLFYSVPLKSWAIASATDYGTHIDEFVELVKCPYGDIGDRLWVRETFCESYEQQCADAAGMTNTSGKYWDYRADFENPGRGWRPSIHMPRGASRITLEITYVRVERLQDISEADAIAEGCKAWKGVPGDGEMSAVEAFRRLWESINGADSWKANPWVWVVSFERATGAK